MTQLKLTCQCCDDYVVCVGVCDPQNYKRTVVNGGWHVFIGFESGSHFFVLIL